MPKLSPAKWQTIIVAFVGFVAAVVHVVAPDYAHAADIIAALFTGGAVIPRPQERALPGAGK